MPVDAHWVVEPHVLSVDFSGHIGIDDMRSVIAVCVVALSNGPVHFLIDFSQLTSLDPDIIQLSSFSEWLYHPNARWFAYVRLTGLYKNLLQHRHHNNIKFFQDRGEAENFLRQMIQAVTDP